MIVITSTPAPLLLKDKGPGDGVFRVNSLPLGAEFGSRACPGVHTN